MSGLPLLGRLFASPMRSGKFWWAAILATIVGVALLWEAGVLYLGKLRERRLVAAITERGDGYVSYDYEDHDEIDAEGNRVEHSGHPSAPAWIRRMLGDDFFGRPVYVGVFPKTRDELLPVIAQLTSVTHVDLWGVAAASEPFKAISTLPHLSWLGLNDSADFHDLAQIPPMSEVRTLQLIWTRVTDADCGLIVQKFPGVAVLQIAAPVEADWAQPSDCGLSAIRQLPSLTRLLVKGSKGVSYDGIASFSGSSRLRELCVEVRGNVDEGRMRIHDCPLLERLEISQHRGVPGGGLPWKLVIERLPHIKEVSVENVDELRLGDVRTLEKISLNDCNLPVTDLSQLAASASLAEVELRGFEGDVSAALRELGKISSLILQQDFCSCVILDI